ncbi:hypothetical protein A3H74_04030 [Candidatus Kaiserbacteria bacterium RIFCSPLOWO2_02_FULL_51_13]|uniref:Uncharacterized protein n=1 Tax=Candidatus Kaiserbacteria bacterium RIFCSPLOWO2_01_FULL_50_24 TaxID=1798507 RepID=A0A1F6END6_9BACT|nr:MAG: hypothetical protein A3A34_02280 [Candidatus Kaiserbacteria bacterium RIFCSPLOWO2_01_FULL_50_24]OGG81063.1 MAG: hypothetical protein A3H74_04030 [Candidatus Kaiserbacteria bacterium RIFCSPLOWO2_02_FULL_51_13]
MDKKTYFLVSAVIFGVFAVLHAARVFFGWDAEIGGFAVPVWGSWIVVAVGGFMAWHGWQYKG